MADIVSSLLTAVTTLVQTYRAIRETLDTQQSKNAQVDLRSKFDEMERTIAEVQRAVKECTDALQLKPMMYYHGGCFWMKTGDAMVQGPYCPKCWEADQKSLHLINDEECWFCPQCRTTLTDVRTPEPSVLTHST